MAVRHRPRSRSAVLALATVPLALGTLTACGGTSQAGSSHAASEPAPANAPAAGVRDGLTRSGLRFDASDSAAQDPGASSSGGSGTTEHKDATATQSTGASSTSLGDPSQDRTRLIRTVQLVLETRDITKAAAQVRVLTAAAGGYVASEVTGTVPAENQVVVPGADATGQATIDLTSLAAAAGQDSAVLMLRIPVQALDRTVGGVAGLGKELSRTSTALDVTGDIADVASRVQTQRESLARVRALLSRATKLGDVVQLESELSRRESDLEALEARQASLTGQADLSTLTVVVRTPQQGAPRPHHDDHGFVGGLEKGWRAVTRTVEAVLLVIGALIPPLAILCLIVALLWLVGSRRGWRIARWPGRHIGAHRRRGATLRTGRPLPDDLGSPDTGSDDIESDDTASDDPTLAANRSAGPDSPESASHDGLPDDVDPFGRAPRETAMDEPVTGGRGTLADDAAPALAPVVPTPVVPADEASPVAPDSEISDTPAPVSPTTATGPRPDLQETTSPETTSPQTGELPPDDEAATTRTPRTRRATGTPRTPRAPRTPRTPRGGSAPAGE